MNRKSLVIFFSLSLLGPTVGNAQEPSNPPTPPFMVVPTDATWTMTVNAPNGAGTSGGVQLRERQVAQKGPIRQEINLWSDGSKTETWIIDKIRLIGLPSNRGIHVLDPMRDPVGAADAARDEFLSIQWLGLNAYVGPESYQGHLCYHFRLHPTPANATGTTGKEAGETWIDTVTKLMVAYNDGTNLYTFVFGPPPASLVPPTPFTLLLKKYEQDTNPLNIPMPPH